MRSAATRFLRGIGAPVIGARQHRARRNTRAPRHPADGLSSASTPITRAARRDTDDKDSPMTCTTAAAVNPRSETHPWHLSGATTPAAEATADTPGLHLEGITLDVADGGSTRRVLDDVSLQVGLGEVVGLTGPSGSGKSTLLAVAGCLQAPTSGTAVLNTGTETIALGTAAGRAAARTRREHLGIVFQQPNLLPSLSVMDQLLVMPRLASPLPLGRRGRREAAERACELLAQVGLADHRHRKAAELSGGQQARVNLARALMNSPQLLLVDEPTAALDTATAGEITQLIVDMARRDNAATLYVSHDREQLSALERVVTLVDGRVSA